VILPRHGKECASKSLNLGDDSESDTDSDSEDDKSKKIDISKLSRAEKLELIDASELEKNEYYPHGKYLAHLFDQYNNKKISTGLTQTKSHWRRHKKLFDITPDLKAGKHKLEHELNQFRTDFYQHRVIIVIDRRGRKYNTGDNQYKNNFNFNSHSNNSNSNNSNNNENSCYSGMAEAEAANSFTDRCMIYEAPHHLGRVQEHNTFQHYICSASTYLAPEYNPVYDMRYIGAKFDSSCKMFVVSFQIKAQNEARMQWFINGGGVQLFPEYMTTVWPQQFVAGDDDNKSKAGFVQKNTNNNFENIRRRFDHRWFEHNWKLKFNRIKFQKWYNMYAPEVDHPLKPYDASLHNTKFQLI
jgi:hypothetical protein